MAKSAKKKPEKVKQVVFSALLEALNEIIGPDGKMSVIRFAGLSNKYTTVRPSLVNSLPRSDMIKLTTAMSRLLGFGSKALLRETGRKFAVYLSPYGYSIEALVDKLTKWIEGDWSITIKKDKDTFKFTIKNDPFHSASYIWAGFFEVAATSSSQEGAKFIAGEVTSHEAGNTTMFELKKQ
ncbi:MAG: hypothetical protein GYA24_10995 [Candidatus Lokiarchaeota archaeon]|nr:hypothetical protein [Candidatus Lokiarchaeota archaeon]